MQRTSGKRYNAAECTKAFQDIKIQLLKKNPSTFQDEEINHFLSDCSVCANLKRRLVRLGGVLRPDMDCSEFTSDFVNLMRGNEYPLIIECDKFAPGNQTEEIDYDEPAPITMDTPLTNFKFVKGENPLPLKKFGKKDK